jgi:regulator of protease activity HflC (stomatin/prohibitin superfamily)
MLVTLVAVVLFPYAAVTVPSGHVGVLWKRFGGGTVLDPRQIRDEGLHLIWPWNELFLYDLRLQSVTETYNAISSDGVSLSATMNIRFRLQRAAAPVIHQAIGPNYLQLLMRPGIGSLTREVMAQYTAEQVYSTARQEIQDKIRSLSQDRLSEKMMEREGDEPYRVSLSDTVILYDTLVYGIELPCSSSMRSTERSSNITFQRNTSFGSSARDASRNARRSRPKAYASSSRLSAKGYRTPTCGGAASRRRFSSHNPRIRRS